MSEIKTIPPFSADDESNRAKLTVLYNWAFVLAGTCYRGPNLEDFALEVAGEAVLEVLEMLHGAPPRGDGPEPTEDEIVPDPAIPEPGSRAGKRLVWRVSARLRRAARFRGHVEFDERLFLSTGGHERSATFSDRLERLDAVRREFEQLRDRSGRKTDAEKRRLRALEAKMIRIASEECEAFL